MLFSRIWLIASRLAREATGYFARTESSSKKEFRVYVGLESSSVTDTQTEDRIVKIVREHMVAVSMYTPLAFLIIVFGVSEGYHFC